MAPDENTAWKPPEGYVLTVVPGHYLNARGYEADGSDPRHGVLPDGQIEVAHFFEAEPFVWVENDGKGPNASIEAREAALAGEPLAGWSPNAILLPIEDGWVPDQYVLTHVDDDTPTIEPASVESRELTPAEEADRLRAGIAAAQARLAEIEGGAS